MPRIVMTGLPSLTLSQFLSEGKSIVAVFSLLSTHGELKYVRAHHQHSHSEQKASVWIQPSMAKTMDSVEGKWRTQSFLNHLRSDRSLCTLAKSEVYAQLRAHGFHNDQLKSQRSLCTMAPHSHKEKQKATTRVLKPNESASSKHHGSPSDVSEGETEETDDVGFTDSDVDEELNECGNCSPSGSFKMTEESVEALAAALRDLEASKDVEETTIGATCLRLAQMCDSSEEDPLKVIMYGEKALKFLKPPEVSLDRALCLQAIGSAHYKLDDAEKAVPQLEKAAEILEKLGTNAKENDIARLKYALQVYLGLSKLSLGRQNEALCHYQEGISINERTLAPGSPDLGKSYLQAAEAYIESENHSEALRLCSKALPIYSNFYGSASYQVASLRRLISVVYTDLKEYDKVLCEHKVVRPILKSLEKSKEVASLDLASGEAYLSLEKYKEAIVKLKEVVNETKETSRFHGQALVFIGKAYIALKEGKNGSKYCKRAFLALKNKKFSLDAASSLMQLASSYQQLNEPDQAVAVLKSALEIFEQYPEQQQAVADAEGQIGVLYIFVGKVEEGLPFLEKAAGKIKDIYGPQSEELLAVYNHIAMANLEQGDFRAALGRLESARTIAMELYGQDHPNTAGICNHLVNTYATLDMLDKAIKCQQDVIGSIKKAGSMLGISVEQAEKKLNEFMRQTKVSSSTWEVKGSA